MASCIMPAEIFNIRLLGGRVESTKQITSIDSVSIPLKKTKSLLMLLSFLLAFRTSITLSFNGKVGLSLIFQPSPLPGCRVRGCKI